MSLREERLKDHGSIVFCPERSTLCFGLVNEIGECIPCKYDPCLYDRPEWRAQQQKIDDKRRKGGEQMTEPTSKRTHKKDKSPEQIEKLVTKLTARVHALDAKAQSLYRQGETELAEKTRRQSERIRRVIIKEMKHANKIKKHSSAS